jgi:hypothetical protein
MQEGKAFETIFTIIELGAQGPAICSQAAQQETRNDADLEYKQRPGPKLAHA